MVGNNETIDRSLIMKTKDFEQAKKVLEVVGRNIFDYLTIIKDDKTQDIVFFRIEKMSIVEILKINGINYGCLRVNKSNGDAKYIGYHDGKVVEKEFSLSRILEFMKTISKTMKDVEESLKNDSLKDFLNSNNLSDDDDEEEDEEDESDDEELFKNPEMKKYCKLASNHEIVIGFKNFGELKQFLNLWKNNSDNYKTMLDFLKTFDKLKNEQN